MKEMSQSVKEVDAKFNAMQTKIDVGIATLRVFTGILAFIGIANIGNFLSFIKGLF